MQDKLSYIAQLINRGLFSLHPGQAVAIAEGQTFDFEADNPLKIRTLGNLSVYTIAATRRYMSSWVYPGARVAVPDGKVYSVRYIASPKDSGKNQEVTTLHFFDEEDIAIRFTPVIPDHIASLIHRWKTDKASLSNYDITAMLAAKILDYTGEPEGMVLDDDHTVCMDIEDQELTYNPNHFMVVDMPDYEKSFEDEPNRILESVGLDAGKDWIDQEHWTNKVEDFYDYGPTGDIGPTDTDDLDSDDDNDYPDGYSNTM